MLREGTDSELDALWNGKQSQASTSDLAAARNWPTNSGRATLGFFLSDSKPPRRFACSLTVSAHAVRGWYYGGSPLVMLVQELG